MRDFQGRKKWHRIFRSDFFSFVLLVVVLLLLKSVWGVYKKDYMARINRQEAEIALANLKNKQAGLEKEIARLETDRGVEEELRRRFQVVRPGEQVLVIVDKDNNKAPVAVAKSKSAPEYIWDELVSLISFWK